MRLPFAAVLALAPLLHSADKSHVDFRAEAEAAYRRKDYAKARDAIQAALFLRPDSPRYLHNLAAVAALTGDEAAALDALRQIAALGVATPIERDPDLARLQGSPAFLRVTRQFAENREPLGDASVFAELPGRTGIIEGIAFREATGDLFLGDVHHRCVWRRARDGRVSQFTAEDDELLGIFGLALDETRGILWAAMMAVPEMSGYAADQKGQAALAEFSLANGELLRVVPVPDDGRPHGLGDLVVAPDGTVYATDSLSPIIWQFAPGAEEPQVVLDTPEVRSLQGIVLKDRTLLVADYANGLFRFDLATATLAALRTPRLTTLLGIDGLVLAANGLIAIQNGVEPARVLRLELAPDLSAVTAVHIVARALPNLTDLNLVTLVAGRPTLVAGAGWDGYDPSKSPQPPSHTVRIFQVVLP
jgi:sugar lactone lactonase YvrE